MPFHFCVKRFLVVCLAAFSVLLLIALLHGRPLTTAATESLLWALVSTVIFIATRLYRSRRGQHCKLCGDTPETRAGGACEPTPGKGPK